MKFHLLLALLLPLFGFCQKKSIDKLLETYNTRSIPYISVQELKMNLEAYTILDTRKREEFEVQKKIIQKLKKDLEKIKSKKAKKKL